MLKRVCACILAMMLLMSSVVFATTSSNEPLTRRVRVGVFGYASRRDIFDNQGDMMMSPYSKEYLDHIAKLNNWEYEFVEGTLSQCLSRLEKGEIDLVGPLQYTEERAKALAFTNIESGYDYSALYSYSGANQYFYEDFDHFNEMKVGIVKGNANEPAFDEYCRKNNFTVRKRYYDQNGQLVEALEQGEIDAIVAGRFIGSNVVKTLGTFAVAPYYYATSKDNTSILIELESAIEEITREDPGFNARLFEKYYPNGSVKGDTRLTREEYNFTKKNPVINLATYPDWVNVSEYNQDTGLYEGAAIDIIKNIGDNVGIRIKPNKLTGYYEGLQQIDNRQADIMLVASDAYDKKKFDATESFLEIPLLLVGYDENIPESELRVALTAPGQYTGLQSALPTGATVLDCLDVKGTLDAVSKHEATATIMDSYTLDYHNKKGTYGQFKVIKTLPIKISVRFAVPKNADRSLISVLNKSIGQIDPDLAQKIELAHTAATVHKPSWIQVIFDYIYIFIAAGVLVAISFVFVYIYHRQRMKKETQSVAYTDTLLGIRNFEKFKIDSDALFSKFKQDDFSLIYFDVNRFKYINDNFGYKVGNEVLCHVAECTSELLYEYELFARVSSDNFIMLLKNTDEKQIVETIKRLCRLVQSHPTLSEMGHQISLCFGIYRLPSKKEDFYTSLDRANAARKTIKGSYQTSYAFYDDKMLRQLSHEVELGAAMRPALDNGEFKLFLQPKHNVTSREVVGAEALVRWDNPAKGIIQPNDFIPLMEKNGFIVSIDFFIFEEACKAIRHMLDNNFVIYPISVNLSRTHMQSRSFISKLNDIVLKYKIDPSYIELELTETLILQNQKEVLSIMHALKELGFSVSLDDFGTGYSSLSLLMEMPVDVLKLDKSFLRAIIATPKERTVLNDIINMAHHLNMNVVCEGVETNEQLELLSEINCDIAQGYLFSKPLPLEDYFNYVI